MKPKFITMFHNRSSHPKSPDWDVELEMDDGTRIKAAMWAKTRRDGTPVTTTNPDTKEQLPVYGGSFKYDQYQEDIQDTQDDPF